MPDSPATPAAAAAPRFLVLVPVADEWHVATNAGRLITTTERSQVALGRIEGKRAPFIGADNLGTGRVAVSSIDLTELITGQVAPAAPDSSTD
jgi:hypothetical protein